MELVTVFRTFNEAEAQLIRSRLESENFHPFLANEYSNAALGGGSPATSLRIEVPEEEAAEAREFLAAPAE